MTNLNFKEMKSGSLAFVLMEGSALLVWDWVNTIDLPKKGVSRTDSPHVEMHEHVDFG